MYLTPNKILLKNRPFGMAENGRKFTQGNSKYKYSINTQEKETDLSENITTAEYWEYDSRTGRRWNLDQKPNTSISPYNCFAGNPILNSDRLGDTPRVKMNNEFYSLVRGKDNNLKYVDAGGKDYKGTLTANAQSVLSATAKALSSGSTFLAGRANTILNSKFDLFITEDQFELTGSHGTGHDELYAYKLADGSVKQAKNTETQPSNSVGAYISLTGLGGMITVGTPGHDIRSLLSGSQTPTQSTPAVLNTVHEIFGHGWQAINKMLGPERVQNWKGGTLLGAPKKAEADAVGITNMFALHNMMGNLIQQYYPESGVSPQDPNKTYLLIHKVPWGFLLGTLNGALQNYPEPKK
jgi:hypothetical protein